MTTLGVIFSILSLFLLSGPAFNERHTYRLIIKVIHYIKKEAKRDGVIDLFINTRFSETGSFILLGIFWVLSVCFAFWSWSIIEWHQEIIKTYESLRSQDIFTGVVLLFFTMLFAVPSLLLGIAVLAFYLL